MDEDIVVSQSKIEAISPDPDKAPVTHAELAQTVKPFLTRTQVMEIVDQRTEPILKSVKKVSEEFGEMTKTINALTKTITMLTGQVEILTQQRNSDIERLQREAEKLSKGHEEQGERLVFLESCQENMQKITDRVTAALFGSNSTPGISETLRIQGNALGMVKKDIAEINQSLVGVVQFAEDVKTTLSRTKKFITSWRFLVPLGGSTAAIIEAIFDLL